MREEGKEGFAFEVALRRFECEVGKQNQAVFFFVCLFNSVPRIISCFRAQ